ncbi:MAG: tetratricopeptide repeat protein, partial [Terriglobales bacterium]
LNAPNAGQLPKKARKAILHGVAALKSGDYKEAEKHLDAARRLAPNSGDVNFLSGYLAFQQKHYDVAKGYLHTASKLDPHNLQAFTLLGRICLQQEDYQAGLTALNQAVAINPRDWLAHDLLAETYLKQHQFEKAREQAQAAIECNKVASSGSQLVLGEALANLGHTAEAVEALKTFLRQAPDSPAAAQVRDLISEVERMPVAAVKGAAPVTGPDPRLAGAELRFHAMNWQPPGIDDAKPEVAAGVACPTEKVVEMAGQRVKELADDVARFAAIEDLLHERLDETGFPTTKETRKFNYVASISESTPGFLEVNEYRSERTGLDDLPDHIASNGFVSLALVFHPDMRDNFEMICEGLGDWHGQATWLVHFKQRADRPDHFHSYVVNGTTYPVALKGRAWIKADKFQIVHMESELVAPAPAIQLLAEHQIVDYGPVPFGKQNEELWLPHSAELYFNFRNRRYFRRHSFDHFMLFSVDSAEKRNEPKEPPQPAATNSN